MAIGESILDLKAARKHLPDAWSEALGQPTLNDWFARGPDDARSLRRHLGDMLSDAGWRGKLYGGAMFSPLHSNFMINTGTATAADLEGLGEAVRADVKAKTGVDLHWEIKRIGTP